MLMFTGICKPSMAHIQERWGKVGLGWGGMLAFTGTCKPGMAHIQEHSRGVVKSVPYSPSVSSTQTGIQVLAHHAQPCHVAEWPKIKACPAFPYPRVHAIRFLRGSACTWDSNSACTCDDPTLQYMYVYM